MISKVFNFFLSHMHKLFAIYVIVVILLFCIPRIRPFGRCAEVFYGKWLKSQYLLDICRLQETHDVFPYKILPVILVVVLILLYFLIPYIVTLFKKVISFELTKVDYPIISTKHIWLTGLAIVLLLIIKELIDPFYFVHDDNHMQMFPRILAGLRLIFEGRMPFLDNYQHYGLPLFEAGLYACLDPLMIVSYVFSSFVFHNRYLTLDVYVVLCMFVGAIFYGYSLRILKIDALVGVSAIISFILSGFFFICARSWYPIVGIGCYMSVLLFFFLLAVRRNIDWKWFLGLGIARSIFFYAGNIQYFVFGIIIEFFSYIAASFQLKQGYKIFLSYLISVVFTIGLSLPLLIPEYLSVIQIPPSIRYVEPLTPGDGVPFNAFVSSFLPHPFTTTYHPIGWGNVHTEQMTSMYHIGIVWMFAYFIGLLIYIRSGKAGFGGLIILATALLFMSAGAVSILYTLKYYLPMVNKMRQAFKLFPFATLMIVLYGAIVLSYVRKFLIFRKLIIYPVILSVIATLYVMFFVTDTSFLHYKEKPYPSLNPGIKNNVDREDVIYSFAPWKIFYEPHVTFLEGNYSCIFDKRVANVYDPLVSIMIGSPPLGRLDLERYFMDHGITKVIQAKINGVLSYPEYSPAIMDYPVVYEDKDLIIYSTGQPKWLLRQYDGIGNSTHEILKYTRGVIKAKIYSRMNSKWEYHNEFRAGYYLKIDGKRGKIIHGPSLWCAFEVPAGEHEIEVGYVPPGFWQSVFGGMLMILFSIFAFRKFKNRCL